MPDRDEVEGPDDADGPGRVTEAVDGPDRKMSQSFKFKLKFKKHLLLHFPWRHHRRGYTARHSVQKKILWGKGK